MDAVPASMSVSVSSVRSQEVGMPLVVVMSRMRRGTAAVPPFAMAPM